MFLGRLLKVNSFPTRPILIWGLIILFINLLIGFMGVEDLIKELSKLDLDILLALGSIIFIIFLYRGLNLIQTLVTSALSVKEFFQTYTEKIQQSYIKLETAMDRTIDVSDKQTDLLFRHIADLERVERSALNSEKALNALPGFIHKEMEDVSTKLENINKHLEIIGKDIKDLNVMGKTELDKIHSRLTSIESENPNKLQEALKETETKVVEILQTIRGNHE